MGRVFRKWNRGLSHLYFSVKYKLKNTLTTDSKRKKNTEKNKNLVSSRLFVNECLIRIVLTLYRSCAQKLEQGLFLCEDFCALTNASTRRDMTILASPMLETLDVALHGGIFMCAEASCQRQDGLRLSPNRLWRCILELLDRTSQVWGGFEATPHKYCFWFWTGNWEGTATVTHILFSCILVL